MYTWKDLFKVLGLLLVIILCILSPFIVGYIITLILIWFCNGVFNYDLSDKFWYLYVGIVFLLPLLRSTVRIKIDN